MSLACPSKLEALQDRADMLRAARQFFLEKGVMEVDCPMITNRASVDAHIDLFHVVGADHRHRYLHSSPEYAMKRLLAMGSGDIYQLGHVFRDDEVGERHNPEFTMAEWYRRGFSFDEMIDETLDFVRLFLGPLQEVRYTYRQVFLKFAGIDPITATIEEMTDVLESKGIALYDGIEGKDAYLNLLLGTVVEPHFEAIPLLVLQDYPASQAALAKTVDGVAKRFEIYSAGVELANGYWELANSDIQLQRFLQANQQRKEMGKEELPIDRPFLAALDQIGDCCGVAVGFDRLMMLRQRSKISDIIPFNWAHA